MCIYIMFVHCSHLGSIAKLVEHPDELPLVFQLVVLPANTDIGSPSGAVVFDSW